MKTTKAACGNRAKKPQPVNRDAFSTSHQQAMSNHFLGSRTSVHVEDVLEDKHLNNKYPPPQFS